jgi:hypothetical protein
MYCGWMDLVWRWFRLVVLSVVDGFHFGFDCLCNHFFSDCIVGVTVEIIIMLNSRCVECVDVSAWWGLVLVKFRSKIHEGLRPNIVVTVLKTVSCLSNHLIDLACLRADVTVGLLLVPSVFFVTTIRCTQWHHSKLGLQFSSGRSFAMTLHSIP